jgi:endonuclease/exonuclease/phosphatase family metal-dependent hydrolase
MSAATYLASGCDIATRLRIGSWNVHKCRDARGRFVPERTTAVILEMDADILALQEVDIRFGRRIGLLDSLALHRAGWRVSPVSDIPEGHGFHGNALLVRRGLPDPCIRCLHLPGLEPRGALVARFSLGCGDLMVMAVHLGLARRSRVAQVGAILRLCEEGVATVVLGDMNEWRSSGAPLGMLGRRFGSAVTANTFPSFAPLVALDRIFGYPRGLIGDAAVHDTPLARRASDHLPVTADIDLSLCSRGHGRISGQRCDDAGLVPMRHRDLPGNP